MIQNILEQTLSSLSRGDFPAGDRVLLVTGGNSYDSSGASEQIGRIFSGIECHRYSGFAVNPRIEDVNAGLSMVRDNQIDLIIAIGGGSPMDMGKLLKAFSNVSDDPYLYISGRQKLPGNDIPLVAIPTTAGSGSESTHFAVVYRNKVKYSLAHQSLLPDLVVLDDTLTASMSPYQTACSGLDALTQATESYWSRNSTEESRDFARQALSLVFPNLVEAVTNPSPTNRRAMQQGANLAGRAINISKTTGAHAFCYYLTSYFDVPHGHAAALMLLVFLRYNSSSDSPGDDRTFEDLYSLLGGSDVDSAIANVRRIMVSCDLKTKLSEVMNLDSEFDGFFDAVNLERLKNNPRPVEDRTVFRSYLD